MDQLAPYQPDIPTTNTRPPSGASPPLLVPAVPLAAGTG